MQVEEGIKNVMIEKNLSRKQFAGILGVNQTTVSQWLSGKKKSSYESILMLYKKFDIQPNFIRHRKRLAQSAQAALILILNYLSSAKYLIVLTICEV